MTSPTGILRARAVAAGVEMPAAGSFQDAVIQEVHHRDLNLRYCEQTMIMGALREVVLVVYDLIEVSGGEKTELVRRKEASRTRFNELLKSYEAELYQDRYLPEYQRQHREKLREQRRAQLDHQRRLKEAERRVAALG